MKPTSLNCSIWSTQEKAEIFYQKDKEKGILPYNYSFMVGLKIGLENGVPLVLTSL